MSCLQGAGSASVRRVTSSSRDCQPGLGQLTSKDAPGCGVSTTVLQQGVKCCQFPCGVKWVHYVVAPQETTLSPQELASSPNRDGISTIERRSVALVRWLRRYGHGCTGTDRDHMACKRGRAARDPVLLIRLLLFQHFLIGL